MSYLRPVRYAIHITPDLSQFRFDGQVAVTFETDAPVDHVILNALELAIWTCQMDKGERRVDLPFALDPASETLTVRLPEPQTGRFELHIQYQGIINDRMAGFYRSQATYDGRTHLLAVTQFQESSARQAFPCMDHPRQKAVFELTMTVPDHLTVLANTLPMKEEQLDNGRKRVTFQPTPVMSTYLVFFGLGDFELQRDRKDARVRLAHLPGMAHTTGLGLDFGRKALQYCERYYGIDYPLPKMDLIAVPDFAFGAMENWGAITFRENLLLNFPEHTSKAGIERICEVIAHEIAHQWFGNLVTPADWKYLWLNESFATYFGYGVVAHYHPDWGIWEQFLTTETATALTRDGLKETFAIEIPGGEHVVINSSTAPIIYNKGASILRMIEGYIGTETYQQGVRSYLGDHQYDCAESYHLWQAFEKVSAQPITAMMQNWIGQPGHPLVTVSRSGNELVLRQQRFTYLDMPGDQVWHIPLTITVWTGDRPAETLSLLMDTERATLPLPPDCRAYKLNSRQSGFYRVHYEDKENWAALGELVAGQVMDVEDRWGLQNDLYALVRQARVELGAWLDALGRYGNETAFLPLTSMAGNLFQALLIASEARRPAVAAAGKALADRALSHCGLRPAEDEPHTTAILRDQLLWQAAVWGLDSAIDFACEQFDALTAGHPTHPDIAKAVMQIGAWTRGEQALGWLIRRFEQSPSEHERMNILAAFGGFQDWQAARKALAHTLASVPPRNRFMPIVAMAANPTLQTQLWPWYLENLNALEDFHPLLYERVITAIIPFGGLGRETEVRHFSEAYIAEHPCLADAFRLALENLEINTRMRNSC
ncbi:M1 family metallopeptidase [Desulfatitalea tepidiphila]|uniref:M1 family metallopeptidase n=1 Tax=Desulfatitalea tepidiphila TaxID=1185843 RepID=UPI0006B5DF09|nr:M1 family metallopeptidase [Desulfatitalea tepidiphila]